jgi:hypothetical protein
MNFTNIPAITFYHDETLVATLIVAFILNGIAILYIESIAATRLDDVVAEVRELNLKIENKDSDSDSDYETDSETEQPYTFEFAAGGYAHYFEDPDLDFILVLPDDTLRGDTIIEATMGHVTRSNPHGSPIITYLDFDGSRQTYVLPQYAGRKFCEFINSKL